jgi:hypothetical protein
MIGSAMARKNPSIISNQTQVLGCFFRSEIYYTVVALNAKNVQGSTNQTTLLYVVTINHFLLVSYLDGRAESKEYT